MSATAAAREKPTHGLTSTGDLVPSAGLVAADRKMALVGRRHEALHRRALTIDDPTQPEWRRLAERMYATLLSADGHALAAPQVGVEASMVVTRAGDALCNVEVQLLSADVDTTAGPETCLSIPGRTFFVERCTYVRVLGCDIDGNLRAKTFDDFTARLWQHEHDHLEGILISDRWPEVRAR